MVEKEESVEEEEDEEEHEETPPRGMCLRDGTRKSVASPVTGRGKKGAGKKEEESSEEEEVRKPGKKIAKRSKGKQPKSETEEDEPKGRGKRERSCVSKKEEKSKEDGNKMETFERGKEKKKNVLEGGAKRGEKKETRMTKKDSSEEEHEEEEKKGGKAVKKKASKNEEKAKAEEEEKNIEKAEERNTSRNEEKKKVEEESGKGVKRGRGKLKKEDAESEAESEEEMKKETKRGRGSTKEEVDEKEKSSRPALMRGKKRKNEIDEKSCKALRKDGEGERISPLPARRGSAVGRLRGGKAMKEEEKSEGEEEEEEEKEKPYSKGNVKVPVKRKVGRKMKEEVSGESESDTEGRRKKVMKKEEDKKGTGKSGKKREEASDETSEEEKEAGPSSKSRKVAGPISGNLEPAQNRKGKSPAKGRGKRSGQPEEKEESEEEETKTKKNVRVQKKKAPARKRKGNTQGSSSGEEEGTGEEDEACPSPQVLTKNLRGKTIKVKAVGAALKTEGEGESGRCRKASGVEGDPSKKGSAQPEVKKENEPEVEVKEEEAEVKEEEDSDKEEGGSKRKRTQGVGKRKGVQPKGKGAQLKAEGPEVPKGKGPEGRRALGPKGKAGDERGERNPAKEEEGTSRGGKAGTGKTSGSEESDEDPEENKNSAKRGAKRATGQETDKKVPPKRGAKRVSEGESEEPKRKMKRKGSDSEPEDEKGSKQTREASGEAGKGTAARRMNTRNGGRSKGPACTPSPKKGAAKNTQPPHKKSFLEVGPPPKLRGGGVGAVEPQKGEELVEATPPSKNGRADPAKHQGPEKKSEDNLKKTNSKNSRGPADRSDHRVEETMTRSRPSSPPGFPLADRPAQFPAPPPSVTLPSPSADSPFMSFTSRSDLPTFQRPLLPQDPKSPRLPRPQDSHDPKSPEDDEMKYKRNVLRMPPALLRNAGGEKGGSPKTPPPSEGKGPQNYSPLAPITQKLAQRRKLFEEVQRSRPVVALTNIFSDLEGLRQFHGQQVGGASCPSPSEKGGAEGGASFSGSIVDRLVAKVGVEKRLTKAMSGLMTDQPKKEVKVPIKERKPEILPLPTPIEPSTSSSDHAIRLSFTDRSYRKETLASFKERAGQLDQGDEPSGFVDYEPEVIGARTRTQKEVLTREATMREVFGQGDEDEEIPELRTLAKTFPEAAIRIGKNKGSVHQSENDPSTSANETEASPKPPPNPTAIGGGSQSGGVPISPAVGFFPRLVRRRKVRKFRSGFDYIRKPTKKKKKDTNGPAGTDGGSGGNQGSSNNSMSASTPNEEPRKRRPIFSGTLFQESSKEAILSEIKSWIMNKGHGETYLHRAARLGYLDIAQYCLETGLSDVDAKDNAGYTPLFEAAARGHVKLVALLLRYRADPNACLPKGGIRPLHEAVESEDLETGPLHYLCPMGRQCKDYWRVIWRMSWGTQLPPLGSSTVLITALLMELSLMVLAADPVDQEFDVLADAPEPPGSTMEPPMQILLSDTPLPDEYILEDDVRPGTKYLLLPELAIHLGSSLKTRLHCLPSAVELPWKEFLLRARNLTFGAPLPPHIPQVNLVPVTENVQNLLKVERFVV
ncbi:unnamed protein product [Cyprideis torosa]|uniref:Uncharacterized protein n=1 Tax=Cyprideis torosa TaxID=163714 RepID=A0A7R8WAF3_9CRUS|nr:unnamed protein product [Cyprideis torosa]CAG0890936.1 unnamed protein product [Cyprideis torosa]